MINGYIIRMLPLAYVTSDALSSVSHTHCIAFVYCICMRS